MPTRTITIDTLIAGYATPIADATGLDTSDYNPTPSGLADLLRDTAADLSPLDQTREWLTSAAGDLDTIARLGDDNPQARELLARVDARLYEAKTDLELG